MPAEVKVLRWRKGERSGMVVRGAGGPGRGAKSGGGTVRVGGRVPWGAKAEFAYRAGYDSAGRLSVTHVVERGYSAMLKQPEMAAALESRGIGRRRMRRRPIPALRVCRPFLLP